MNSYVSTKLEEIYRELEKNVISMVACLFDEFTEEKEWEQLIERISLLSGIPCRRLVDSLSRTSSGKYISLMTRYIEASNSENSLPWEESYNETYGIMDLSIPEIHALCNALRFACAPFQDEGRVSVFDGIAERSISIIEKWVGIVTSYIETSNTIFEELIAASSENSAEDFFSKYHIFVDTSALCDENMSVLIGFLISEITKLSKPLKVTVPKAVVDCLQEMANDNEKSFLLRANEGLHNLKILQQKGLLSIRGDDADSTVMSTFLSAFSRFKPTYKMVLITQDESLANAVQMLNTSGVEGEDVIVCKISDELTVSLWRNNTGFQDEKPVNEEFDMDTDREKNKIETPAPTIIYSIDKDADESESHITSNIEESKEDDVISSEEKITESELDQDYDDDSCPSETDIVGASSEKDYGIDDKGGPLDQAVINEVETDIEKMSMLEEQLANMLGKNVSSYDDENEDEEDEEDELSDEDDFDDSEALTPEGAKKDFDFDFSEGDTLIADSGVSWDILD